MSTYILDSTRKILNDPELISIRDARMKALTDFYADPNHPKTTQTVPVLCGDCTFRPGLFDKDGTLLPPEEWVAFSLNSIAQCAEIIRDESVFRPVCIEYYTYGVHYIDKLLGAELVFSGGQVYNNYLTTEVGELEYPDLDSHPLWIHSKAVLDAFLKADVKLPYFGLPTIASALNIAVNLYGQDFLIAMLEEPEAAKHDLSVITRLLCYIHSYYRDNLPPEQLQPVISAHRTQPIGCGQVCGCTTQLVSKELYDEFIAPCDEAVLNVYPNPGMIHLCGGHTQHIETFRNMKSLHAVQLNDRAAGDLKYYFEGLRDDQVIYLDPCKEMSAEEAMKITDGRRLVLSMPNRPV